MIELFRVSYTFRIVVTFILGINTLAQTLAIMLRFYRYNQSKTRVVHNLFELMILVEILVLALFHGAAESGYRSGILLTSGYEKTRIAIFLAIMLLGIRISFAGKNKWPLAVIAFAIISLPFMENILGESFPWFFLILLLFLLMRSVGICIESSIAIKNSISALSVIQAVDTLQTGVLFAEKDGYVLLCNNQMQSLMLLITGKIFRDAVTFYEMLLSDKYQASYEKVQLEKETVYLLPDQTVWMFTKTDISIKNKNKNYIHISAADVSENWSLTAKLQQQDQELRRKSNELKNTIANLHILSREKEIEKAKMRVHDVLGQRLTVLLRMIQNTDKLDYELLTALAKGLLDELKAEHNEKSASDELKSIQQVFASIGVNIKFQGQLPNDINKACLFVDVIRESSANAVRHGLATQINVAADEEKNVHKLIISNIGHTSTAPLAPGSGIKAMRKKVEAQGGSLKITPSPQFTLSVVLPGGEKSG